jgi:hypothetical protein
VSPVGAALDARAQAVRRYHEAWRARTAIDSLAVAAAFGTQRLDAHRAFWERRLDAAGPAYCDLVPTVAVARCPLTEEVLGLAIDVVGLDGPWWNHEAPCRPSPAPLPPTMLGFDGALRVSAVPVTPYGVGPGPEVPTVIPRLLEYPCVHAVISSIRIGPDDGYVTSYFAAPDAEPLTLPLSDWGSDHYRVAGFDGPFVPVGAGDEGRDPDLGPWLDTGRCWWIAPGDAALELRQGREACPYLGLPGRADPQWLFEGHSSFASDGARTSGG